MIDYVPRAWEPVVYSLDGLDSSEEETFVVDLELLFCKNRSVSVYKYSLYTVDEAQYALAQSVGVLFVHLKSEC